MPVLVVGEDIQHLCKCTVDRLKVPLYSPIRTVAMNVYYTQGTLFTATLKSLETLTICLLTLKLIYITLVNIS